MSISVCLIVRDDRPFLDDWLRNLGHQDEIVVGLVGEGADGTREWVEKHADEVIEFPETYNEDFGYAKIRNMVANRATKDWIHVLDADERMAEESRDRLPEIIDIVNEEGLGDVIKVRTKTYLVVEDVSSWDQIAAKAGYVEDFHSRIYRRGTAQWYGYLHEWLSLPGTHIGTEALVHDHYSYYRNWKPDKKAQRAWMNYRAYVDPFVHGQVSAANHRHTETWMDEARELAIQYDRQRARKGSRRLFDDSGNLV